MLRTLTFTLNRMGSFWRCGDLRVCKYHSGCRIEIKPLAETRGIQARGDAGLEPSCYGKGGVKSPYFGYISQEVLIGFVHELDVRYGIRIWSSEKRSRLKA